MVTLPAEVLSRYRRFSLYNSPYPAHDRGCAIDLYPETNEGLSPVAGEVLDTVTTRAPEKPYAVEHDHLILVETDDYVARILHVDPAVGPGDVVAVGDSLGPMVRSGFFAPWVDNHVHLGFRTHDQNPYRASGSLPVDVAVAVEPLPWDGTGTVVETGDTYVALDAPIHPDPGAFFAGIAADDGTVLDGGVPHYDGGGRLDNGASGDGLRPDRFDTGGDRLDGGGDEPVSFLGTSVGVADGRDVTWDDVTVVANGEDVTGLSLFAARDAAFGAKVVCPGHDFAVGDAVTVELRRDGDD